MGTGNLHPQMPNGHRSDAMATTFVGTTEAMVKKVHQGQSKFKAANVDKQPAGGYDKTPVPSAPPGFTIKFTFHRAHNLPMADIHTLSSDPFITVQLNTNLPARHKTDPPMRFRSRTIRRNTEPVWDDDWIVANVPADGCELKIKIYDEDPADHDDRLGDVHIHIESINESWEGIREQAYKIKKKFGSKRAYLIRGCAGIFSKGLHLSTVHMAGELVFSAQVLGKTESNNEARVWTVGPCRWTQHLSPLIGRLTGTKDPSKTDEKSGRKTEQYK